MASQLLAIPRLTSRAVHRSRPCYQISCKIWLRKVKANESAPSRGSMGGQSNTFVYATRDDHRKASEADESRLEIMTGLALRPERGLTACCSRRTVRAAC